MQVGVDGRGEGPKNPRAETPEGSCVSLTDAGNHFRRVWFCRMELILDVPFYNDDLHVPFHSVVPTLRVSFLGEKFGSLSICCPEPASGKMAYGWKWGTFKVCRILLPPSLPPASPWAHLPHPAWVPFLWLPSLSVPLALAAQGGAMLGEELWVVTL